jgi:hypothetical protein
MNCFLLMIVEKGLLWSNINYQGRIRIQMWWCERILGPRLERFGSPTLLRADLRPYLSSLVTYDLRAVINSDLRAVIRSWNLNWSLGSAVITVVPSFAPLWQAAAELGTLISTGADWSTLVPCACCARFPTVLYKKSYNIPGPGSNSGGLFTKIPGGVTCALW